MSRTSGKNPGHSCRRTSFMAEKQTCAVTEGDGAEQSPSVLLKVKQTPELLRRPRETQLWKSVFRHKLDETPRNRALAVLSNVFLHLHPARMPRDALRYCFTWGMGGITFYLFIVLTI